MNAGDPVLDEIVRHLVDDHHCHTVILYGSRAKGTATAKSDYDVMGVRSAGEKVRIARKLDGCWLDVFVFPEKDLRRLGEDHVHLRGAELLFTEGSYGDRFLRRLRKVCASPVTVLPEDERQALVSWGWKMLERVEEGGVEGAYRRACLLESLPEMYFLLRAQRFSGGKEALSWLQRNDSTTYALFGKVFANPSDMEALKALVRGVVGDMPEETPLS
ncbi:MAG TPA: nucleotidyltransferase domain-containing protein [Rhodospirillaceae bacterium]|nr:MAG: hypothetical protein A2018_02940 [Alphaproteobacteria bacterium GWF2_58_20]HAU29396.1 nucleotidyltransferase domain-containing protein [Rhodospirillaceae bacterium]